VSTDETSKHIAHLLCRLAAGAQQLQGISLEASGHPLRAVDAESLLQEPWMQVLDEPWMLH
jgi:ABC-type cobalamin/Fe3+-siderophores transport system ATPase subunit